ncbi:MULTISPECIES: GspH/FimT family pseudopilin [unclassified Uliginosibacterium]|uniref:GspH/FimT family pseudopilin n=1 Tax=unclassified Uliginosibacterium TaxID=2621521 RepID=UPI000C7CD7B6|nr:MULTISPECIES: GspH/FimT family pseudopilin [unclassified Uliginosibacterium]MDO6385024.1 GspH/FimT family pseudopilin [Uliginosibacterium sp. 31-12]PLK48904.1 hypothetical protein C0V76_11665 [Uliginosibacterium sp. TH139]
MSRKRSESLMQQGFTLIELMVTVAVLAVLLAIAVPSFTAQIQSGRAQMAADGLKRAVANARAIASQTGKRTTLTLKGGVTGCDPAAWAITQKAATASNPDAVTVVGCLTQVDFSKRYEGTSLAGSDSQSVVFLPTGIATNTSALTYTFTAGSSSKSLTINAGGAVNVL